MFVIQIEDVARILNDFSCNSNVVAIDMLAYYRQANTTCMVLSATTDDKHRYVLKLIDDPLLNLSTEEKQAGYSEFLRNCGLMIPRKYQCDGRYCCQLLINSFCFFTTVEDYLGKDVKEILTESVYAVGEYIGKMHTLALNSQYHLDKGHVFSSLDAGRTTLEPFLKDIRTLIKFDEDCLQRLCSMHNKKMGEARALWHALPTAAVHGDLGLVNNIVYSGTGYGVIDFNLAGDEMLLGDFLITWYSSRYSLDFIRQVRLNQTQLLWNAYLQGYTSCRQLTRQENDAFDALSKILNGTYFGRFIINLFQMGYVDYGNKLFPEIEKHYNLKDTPIDLHGGLRQWVRMST